MRLKATFFIPLLLIPSVFGQGGTSAQTPDNLSRIIPNLPSIPAVPGSAAGVPNTSVDQTVLWGPPQPYYTLKTNEPQDLPNIPSIPVQAGGVTNSPVAPAPVLIEAQQKMIQLLMDQMKKQPDETLKKQVDILQKQMETQQKMIQLLVEQLKKQ